jgi:PhnB protein
MAMRTDVHLVFAGTCDEAFGFYEKVFGVQRRMTMKYADAPGGAPTPEEMKNLVLHTAMPLGSMVLMGCDSPAQYAKPMGGFQISVSDPDEAEVRRIYRELSEGGSVQMPIGPTFWSPLFGMCTDRFGAEWMVSVPGPEQGRE